jgi:lysophospholipase L1-like esterase
MMRRRFPRIEKDGKKTPDDNTIMKYTQFAVNILMICVALIATRTALGDEPVVTDLMLQRSLVSAGDPARIQAVLAKARRGEPICVAAIGGSITAGGENTKDPNRRYIQQLSKWFETAFAGVNVRFINAGIGATDSAYGALRVKRDVLDRHPDLVVVEYAVNDSATLPGQRDSYEGVLRQLLSSSRDLAVIGLFFMHKDGKSAQPIQVELGRHYGLPMISFTDAMWPEFQSGRLKWEDFYDDVVHPSNEGHDVASELLGKFLDDSLAKLRKLSQPLPEVANLPPPLVSDTYERCFLFRGEDFKPVTVTGWTHSNPNHWECSPAGGILEFELPGQDLYLGLSVPPAAKNIEIGVDGAQPVSVAKLYKIAAGLPAGLHKVKLIIQPYPASGDTSKDSVKLWWGGSAGIGAP